MTSREVSPSRILVLADHLGRHLSDMLTYVIRRKAEVMVIFKPYAPMAAVTQDIDALTRSFSRHDAVVVIAGTNDLQLNSSDQIVPLVESMLRHVMHRTRLIVATIPKRYDSSSYKKTISQANKGIRSLRSRYPALKILELEDMGRAYHCSRGFSLNTKGKLKLCVKLSELVAVTPKTKFLNAPFDRIAMFLDPFEPAEDETYLQPFVIKQEHCKNFPVNRVVIESEIKFMTAEGDDSAEDLRSALGSVIGEVILSQGHDLHHDRKSPIVLSVVKNKLNKNVADVSVIKRQKITVSNAERKTCPSTSTSTTSRKVESFNDYSQATTQTTVHSDDDRILQLAFTIRDSDLAFNVSNAPAVIDVVLDLKRILKFCDERNKDCTLVCSDVCMSYDSGDIRVSLKISVAIFSSDSGCGDHLRFDLKPNSKFLRTETRGLEAGDHNDDDDFGGSEMRLVDGKKKSVADEEDPDFFDLSIMNWNELLDISDEESLSSASNEEDRVLDGQRLDLHGLLKYRSRSRTDWNDLLRNDFGKFSHQSGADANSIFPPPKRRNRVERKRGGGDRSSSHHCFSSNLNALCTRLLKCHYWAANGLNKKFCSVSEECNLNVKKQRNGNASVLDEVRKFRRLEGEFLRNRQYDLTLVKETFCNGGLDYLMNWSPYNQRLTDNNTLWEMVTSSSRSATRQCGGDDDDEDREQQQQLANMGKDTGGSTWLGPTTTTTMDKQQQEAEGRSRVLDHKEVSTTARNSRARNYIVRTVRRLLSKLIHLPGNIDSE